MKTICILSLLLLAPLLLCDSLEMDPFKELGIPQISMGGDTLPKKEEIPRLETIDDLPAFVESSYFNTKAGINMLTKFLTEDDDQLKENGGIFDQTGFDGLDKSEDIYPKQTDMRLKQRARSAVNLYVKQSEPDSKYEAYGCIDPDDTHKVSATLGWLSFTVLLMTPLGEHKMQSVCLPDNEKTSIVFVSPNTDIDCNDKSKVSQEIRDRTRKYFDKSGLGQKIQERLGIDIFEDYKDEVVKTPPQQNNNSNKKNKNKAKESNKEGDDVSLIQRQIQELQSKLSKAVKGNNMRFKQKDQKQKEQKDYKQKEQKEKEQKEKEEKEKEEKEEKESKEKEDDQQNSDQSSDNSNDSSTNEVKPTEVTPPSTSTSTSTPTPTANLDAQSKMMQQMQQQFKQHDDLMQNEIKLLKEEVQTMKSGKNNKQIDDETLIAHYKQKKQENKNLNNSIASSLLNKIKQK